MLLDIEADHPRLNLSCLRTQVNGSKEDRSLRLMERSSSFACGLLQVLCQTLKNGTSSQEVVSQIGSRSFLYQSSCTEHRCGSFGRELRVTFFLYTAREDSGSPDAATATDIRHYVELVGLIAGPGPSTWYKLLDTLLEKQLQNSKLQVNGVHSQEEAVAYWPAA
eukprot:TRINITY_DN10869_c0_g1_i1.p1 TRINITY_DN10869_c0_g1~~TRINITY_DN10869_c0_g1_i1.p1  ORF type:complete len:165 (-),score=25.08 TRINITY_DN10869_c0_g1_i1:1324-1818(-)